MEVVKEASDSPPNHIFVLLSKSRHNTASVSMIVRHDRETREARTTVENGRKLNICDTSSGGRRVRKSRASVGVRTECKVRKTGKGEWRKSVSKKWLCRGGGRLVK